MSNNNIRPIPGLFIVGLVCLVIFFGVLSLSSQSDKEIGGTCFLVFGTIYCLFRKQFAAMTIEHQKRYPFPYGRQFTSYDATLHLVTWGSIITIILGMVLLLEVLAGKR